MKFPRFQNRSKTEMIPRKRLPFIVLAVSMLTAGMVFVWSVNHISTLNEGTYWMFASVSVLLMLFIWSWLAVVNDFRRARKTFIANIAEGKRTAKELQKNLSLLTAAFEATDDGIMVVDLNNSIVAYNRHFIEMWNMTEEILKTGRNEKAVAYVLDQLTNADEFAAVTKQLISQPNVKNYDVLHFKDGRIYERYSQPHIIDGTIAGRVLSFRDITARSRADAALRESEYKLRTLLENMNEGISQIDNDHVIEFVNDRFCEMLEYTREELVGKKTYETFLDEEAYRLVKEADREREKGISSQYEVCVRKKSGETVWVIIGGVPIFNAENKLTGTMGVFTDITERKRAEEQLLHDALHDGLTGLANRTLFINHLQKSIERGKRSNSVQYAVLFLDFDRFKVVNDSLGHAEGDNLLKQIARRLENLLRSGDLLARLGGDEFTILLTELNTPDDAVMVAERIQKDLNKPFILGENEVFMSVSIGIAISNEGHSRAEDMLRDADIAMYRAKSKGKAQHQIFDETMHVYAINKFQLETEIHRALHRGEFSMQYQPIVSLETNNLAGFEALIRWNHPERGMISPGDFIPAAEETGLIVPLGRWILYESCRQMREWQKKFPWLAALCVNVNLSCKQFQQVDLAEQITAALISTQLDPHCLKIEITESHVMESSDKAITMLSRLRSLGVGISLDDFGTGYSSLSYLHRLPVNFLKVDRSFVNRMVESRQNGEIVHTIVKLAQNLKMQVIAEGIETVEQFEQLKDLGCEYGQGYLISKPLEAAAASKYLSRLTEPQFVNAEFPVINAELNM